ncbi:SDR family oxidoreductase [Streptomyces sp. 769]|uniref:SDR family NAD(P)-dependent oxidoreductase n=1 Tax=Streptomyces sp. 769 TaxID=1262452 RepID=UPI0005822EA9|nr:SDR family oxidoreductase [Streptomyces sp. 769]AJC62152.1 short-chain dehydrogenase/reductase SDR [Streptomyces sp. 769]
MSRTAVVTGGGSGIGKRVAARLVEQGTDVVICGRRADVLEATADELGRHTVRPCVLDAADPHAVAGALDSLPATVDVLVNCAGGNPAWRLPEVPPDDLPGISELWLEVLQANLLATVMVTTALVPRLADGGRVVNLSSIGVRKGGTAYAAAKAGIESWTAWMAFQLGERGITVNAVAPGLVTDTDFYGDAVPLERQAFLVSQTATKAPALADDVASAIVFLTSAESAQITGQVIAVSGGADLLR